MSAKFGGAEAVRSFINGLRFDLLQIGWRSAGLIAFAVMAVYGLMLMNPTTAYDFNAAKGDSFQVFLTYFFMRRFTQGLIAGLFHDFTPMWNWAIGLFALFIFANMMFVLSRRLRLTGWQSLIFVVLLLSAPFFFNRSIYQHAMPAEPIAFCCDALILLLFAEVRGIEMVRARAKIITVAACFGFVSLGVYQAHANLLLTAMFGICCILPRHNWRGWVKDVCDIILILVASVSLWVIVNYGPILAAKAFGVTFPSSGGAHDTVYWFKDSMSFGDRLAGLFIGLILNWGYNAFFVIGLRWVLVCMALIFGLVIYFAVTGNRVMTAHVFAFLLSIFVMPCLQCSSANLRIFYCLSPFIAFSVALLLKRAENRRCVYALCTVMSLFACMSLAHETSTLYYYNWKLKSHDAFHMGNVATDIWRLYGLSPKKPVAVIGGWSFYPTCWEDMRPNSDMPLLAKPFTTYSNMTDRNVPREFYMVSREKVGLVVDMPSKDAYDKAKTLTDKAPAYPQDGYIFENEGLIVVNLGSHTPRWNRFLFKSYRSPNEKLLFNTIGEERWNGFRHKMIKPFLNLAARYPWTVTID